MGHKINGQHVIWQGEMAHLAPSRQEYATLPGLPQRSYYNTGHLSGFIAVHTAKANADRRRASIQKIQQVRGGLPVGVLAQKPVSGDMGVGAPIGRRR